MYNVAKSILLSAGVGVAEMHSILGTGVRGINWESASDGDTLLCSQDSLREGDFKNHSFESVNLPDI